MTATATATCERLVKAPVDRVWDAWTDPALLAQWYCPNPALELKVDADVRPGGAYRVQMGENYVATGTYTRVEAPHRLEFTWAWDFEDTVSDVAVELTETADGTLVRLTHSGLANEEDAAGHAEGWELSLNRLQSLDLS